MKYKCSHCQHVCDLSERDFHRCPNCFWTTSLIPVESVETGPVSGPPNLPMPNSSHQPILPWGKIFFWFSIMVVLAASIYAGVHLGARFLKPGKKIIIPKVEQKTQESKTEKKILPSISLQELESALTAEERSALRIPFSLTIPRQLSEDEEAILKKEVSFPVPVSKKPEATEWTKKEFEELLEKEQNQKKIFLGWWYVRSLTNVFEENYPKGVEAFKKAEYAPAQDFFLKALQFPVYQNNPKAHRAVMLVMLRPYINDVLGKMATLNQYLLSQEMLSEARALFESYRGLFSVLDLHEWDKALEMIRSIRAQVKEFEGRPRANQMNQPASFSQLDQELKQAVLDEAQPKPEAAVNLKPLQIDLDLKEKVVRDNTQTALLQVKKQYEEALRKLENGEWQSFVEMLQSIEFPEELAGDARKKLALIDKALAVKSEKSK